MGSKVYHAELWGTRANKYAAVREQDITGTEWAEPKPQSPFYLFTAQATERLDEYGQGWKVTGVLAVNSVAIVTARDALADVP